MKRVVRCARCAMCVRVAGCGFVAEDRLVCQGRGGDVDPDDGCTLGVPGEPSTGCVGYDVTIGGEKAQLMGVEW